MAAKSRTAKFYASHSASRKKHNAYQAEFNKKPEQVKKRVQLNAYNRKHKSTKSDDAIHKGSRIVGFGSMHKNRGSKTAAPGDRRSRSPRFRPGGRKK